MVREGRTRSRTGERDLLSSFSKDSHRRQSAQMYDQDYATQAPSRSVRSYQFQTLLLLPASFVCIHQAELRYIVRFLHQIYLIFIHCRTLHNPDTISALIA